MFLHRVEKHIIENLQQIYLIKNKHSLILTFNNQTRIGSLSFGDKDIVERCLWLSFRRSLKPRTSIHNFVHMCISLETVQPSEAKFFICVYFSGQSNRLRFSEVSISHREGNADPLQYPFAWKIPWMEEPGRLQSMGSLRVGHDWATSLPLFTFMHWRRKWQPTPVFVPGESQGRGTWWAAVFRVAESRTRLKRQSSSSTHMSTQVQNYCVKVTAKYLWPLPRV